MLGQLLDPFAPAGGAFPPAGGAVGIVFAGAVVAVLEAAEEVDVAALAIAAPPPASKPAAASVATRGLIRCMFGSPPFVALARSSPARM
jgi:hypothetical protein